MRDRALMMVDGRRTMHGFLILLAALLVLAACTDRERWSTHDVTIVTEPPGALCSFARDGLKMEAAEVTPVSVTFTSIGPDIDIRCTVFGHDPVTTRISNNRSRTIRLQMSPIDQAQNAR